MNVLRYLTLFAFAISTFAQEAPPEFSIDLSAPIHTLPFRVIDAEFSPQLNAIVAVAAEPNSLRIYYPDTQELQTVLLAQTPRCVSVRPDGLFAAVGHDGHISHVDLAAAELESTLDVSCNVLDVVLAGNGYVYAFPREDQWSSIHSVHIATNDETTGGGFIYAGTVGRLHPDGQSMYGAENNLSPSDIEKYDISGGTAMFEYDSPYHGDYAMCGNLWISADGTRIFTACGNIFRSTNNQSTDMLYAGKFSNDPFVDWVSSSTIAGIAVIPAPVATEIRYYTSDFFTYRGRALLPPFMVQDNAWSASARWHFFSAAGTRQYIVVQADEDANLDQDYGVVTIDCTNAAIALSADEAQVGPGPSTLQTTVTGTPGCGWTAVPNVPWLNSLSSGVSDGPVAITVSTNPSTSPRSGTVTMGSATFTVNQGGAVPTFVTATPASPTSVSVTWTSPAADSYEVWRSANGTFELIATPTATNFTDTVTPGTGYIYKVRAVTGGGLTEFGIPDTAYPFPFTDPSLLGTPIRAVHVDELRGAVNALRVAAGIGAASFTDPALPGVAIKRLHVTELRNRLNEARTAVGMPEMVFSALPVNSAIAAAKTQELRAAVQ